MRARVKDQVWLIERINSRGYRERVQFVGSLRLKPKGWRVIGCLGPAMAMESGTV